jgi:hypothetical protein
VRRALRAAGRLAAVLALGVLLSLAVLELWMRLQPRRLFAEFDETLGFRLEPGAEGEYRGVSLLADNPHIRTPVKINALGIRGPERAIAKPPGVRRLIVLGDSFVVALEVPYEQTVTALLELRAAAARAAPVEGIALGMTSYGQAQEWLWLQRTGVPLAPDVVLLMVHLGNDVEDNYMPFGTGSSRPYYDLAGGALVQVGWPDRSARWKYAVAKHLRSFILLREVALRVAFLKRAAGRAGLLNFAAGKRIDPELIDKQRRGWALTLALIREIARTSEAAGALPLVAWHGTFPTGTEQTPAQAIAAFCAAERLECLDLHAALTGRAELFVPDDEHWSARGHERAAELVWQRWGRELAGDATSTPRRSRSAR